MSAVRFGPRFAAAVDVAGLQIARLHRLPVVVARSLGRVFEQCAHVLVEGVVEIAGDVHVAQFVLHSRFDDGIRHRRLLAPGSFKLPIFATLAGSIGTLHSKSGVVSDVELSE